MPTTKSLEERVQEQLEIWEQEIAQLHSHQLPSEPRTTHYVQNWHVRRSTFFKRILLCIARWFTHLYCIIFHGGRRRRSHGSL